MNTLPPFASIATLVFNPPLVGRIGNTKIAAGWRGQEALRMAPTRLTAHSLDLPSWP